MAHQKYGVLPWADLVEPSIQLSEQGWKVESVLAKRIKSAEDAILKDPTLSAVFAPQGTLLQEGQLIRRPVYAKTLRVIAQQGIQEFYSVS